MRSKAAKTHKSHRLQGLLLDIGCAYGPFLVAAREEGFSPAGIDPAEDAVRYVTQTLGIPAVQGFFPGCRLPECNGASGGGRLFDAVTLWYVIEHFQNCVPVLAEIRRILKPGGVLSFSSPSFTGISGRSSLKRFLAQSPADHWTIWSPAMCKKALARAGFKVMKIVISGHHPDRFPLLGRFAHKKGPLSVFLTAASKLFALGDTFEVYALAGRLSAAGPRGEPLGEPQGPVWGVAEDPKGPERRGGGQKRRRCADHVWKQPPLPRVSAPIAL
ncbi:MAG: class I SAM-dependent methyltransferase [Treponema sp.]|nr:class I SAM-dependent methyltransferase [Treponema sp.]